MNADETQLGHDEDDHQILEQLAKDFAGLRPGADLAAFENRVEMALARVKAEVPRALLHYLAAEAVANSSGEHLAGSLDRAVDHVERARSTLVGLGPATYAEIGGPIAVLRARLLLTRENALGDDLVSSVDACEEAMGLVPPHKMPDAMGALAYNAGLRLLRLEPSASPDSSMFLRAQALFRRALESYDAAGMAERASDAAENLAALALRQLEAGGIGAARQQERFDDAWRLAERAMAQIDSTASPTIWARRNELAAAILRLQPGRSAEANARDAIKYLDRALIRYQTGAADVAAAARCADTIIELMHMLPPPWSTDMAKRYTSYLDVRADHPGAAARAAQAIAATGAWAKVADDLTARSRYRREYAEQALAAATEAGDEAIVASALIQLGNDRMQATTQPDGSDAANLAEACILFEKAIACARNCQNTTLEAQALRQLGVALARRVVDHDDISLLERTLQLLRQAADASQDSERGCMLVNLGNLLVWSARRQGHTVPVDIIKQTIDEAKPLVASDPAAAHGLAQLRQAQEDAIACDGTSPVQFKSPPAALGYRWYRTEERSLGDSGPLAHVITLLLNSDQAGARDGGMELVESRGEISAKVALACPACRAIQLIALPIIASLEREAPRAFDDAERMAFGKLRCTSCASPIIVQSFFALEGGVRGGHSIVYPDALGPSPSEILSHQVSIIGQLHQAYLGKPLQATTLLPWSGIPAFGMFTAKTTFKLQRITSLGELVFGLLTSQIEKIRMGLEGCMHNVGANDEVQADEIAPALSALADAAEGRAPGSDLAVNMAAQINYLIIQARVKGLDVVMARLKSEFADSSATASEIDEALRSAADSNARRALLQRYLEQAPDYSSDREQAIYDLYLLGPELKIRALRTQGMDKIDPQRYAGASAFLEQARQYTTEKIAEDRKRNSAVQGKARLAESLDGGRHFVLLLRAFAVDVPISRLSQVESEHGLSDARIGWRMFTFRSDNSGRSTEKVVEWLTEHVPLLMVVNALDPNPPERAPKLYMTDTEWRTFVFPLIGEAAATVVVLPSEGQTLSGGVLDELAAIDRLGRSADTVIVLADSEAALSDDVFNLITEAPPQVAGATLVSSAEVLRKRGYAAVLREQEIAANPALLFEAVLNLLPDNR